MNLVLQLRYFLFFIILCFGITSKAQVKCQLKEVKYLTAEDVKCFEITLTNVGTKVIALAGQNYRFYYNADNAIFNSQLIKSYLPKEYTSIQLVDHHYAIDATGFGILPYEHNLGFVNLAIDYNLFNNDALLLPADKSSIPIAEVCFTLQNGDKQIAIDWAQKDVTQTYATAFVELSEIYDNKLFPIQITEYTVEQATVSSNNDEKVLNFSLFPNPFSDNLSIHFNESIQSNATVKVFDIFGNQIHKGSIKKLQEDIVIPSQTWLNGAYLVEIITEDGLKHSMKAMKINLK